MMALPVSACEIERQLHNYRRSRDACRDVPSRHFFEVLVGLTLERLEGAHAGVGSRLPFCAIDAGTAPLPRSKPCDGGTSCTSGWKGEAFGSAGSSPATTATPSSRHATSSRHNTGNNRL